MNTHVASGTARYRGAVSDDSSRSPSAPVVALVGMMGSGKTSVAFHIGRRVGWRPVDLDDVISTTAGRSVPEIFASEGESAFREREVAALAAVLAEPGPMVLATGGGCVTTAAARAALRDHATVVWLDTPTSVLLKRVGAGDDRPLLGDDPAGSLAALITARRPLYAEVADVVVDAGEGDAAAVADRVLSALGVLA
jgi:shikimate kinase